MATADEFAGLRPIDKGDRYQCPWEKWKRPGALDLMNWKFRTKDNSKVPKTNQELDKVLPLIGIDRKKLDQPPKDKVQVMWIGHATVLVQFDGITVLTDPIFSDICGPINYGMSEQWGLFGYRRFRPPSCKIADLPKIDAVVISHDHYDHLDKPSVTELNAKFPQLHWYVGKGLEEWFQKLQCKNVYELTWWQNKELMLGGKKFEFVFTPAQHWCGRGVRDENKVLWGSWVVKGPTKSFFFAGDTGYYQPVFKKIGEKFGPFDLAALPIGCYEPRYITKYQHVDPEEAVKIHAEVNSQYSIGIHWGSLVMTNEWYLEPPQKLLEEMGKARGGVGKEADPAVLERLASDRFQCLNHGEVWTVGEERLEAPYMFAENPSSSNM